MSGPSETEGVALPLIEYLRTHTSTPNLAYAGAPARISGGFDTAIYGFSLRGASPEFSGPLILRVFRDGGVDQARFETVVQDSVADAGYPAPRVLALCADPSVLGGAFVIMPRVTGRPMLDRLLGPGILRMPTLMAEAQAALHDLDPARLQRSLEDAGLALKKGMTFEGAWAAMIEHAGLDGLREAYAWVDGHRPTAAARGVCHGDFHPLNVMVDGDRVSGVLDWSNVRIDDPAWDVGATVALFGYAPADLPGLLMPLVNLMRGFVLRRYLRAYEQVRPIDRGSVRYYEATRLLGFMVEAGIVRQARLGVIPSVTKATAFEDPRVLRRITRRFEEISGVPVSLPAAT